MNASQESTLLLLAQQYLQARNADLAKKTLLKILQTNPNSSKANELLAYVEGGLGNTATAIDFLNAACKQQNCSAEALYNLGKYYVDSDQPLKAIDLLKKSISKNFQFLRRNKNHSSKLTEKKKSIKTLDTYSYFIFK